MKFSNKRLGENVRMARERKGMSVEELAMSMREPLESVAEIEKGETENEMSLEVAFSICFALDITMNELLDGVGSME